MIAVLKFMVSFKFDSLPKLEFFLHRCIAKPRVDSARFNAVDYIYWLFGCHWTSRSPHSLNGMYGCLGPFVMAVKCWNVQRLGLIANLFSPRWKRKNWAFLFFFSSRVQLLTLTTNLKLAMRVIQIKKKKNYRECTFIFKHWMKLQRGKRQTRLINNDSCVQESQLVGLNHYLSPVHTWHFHFPWRKKKRKKTRSL